MPDQPEINQLSEILAEKKRSEEKALADMFIQPAVCRMCGAQVVIPEAHKAFHDGIEAWMKNVVTALEKAGFESREQRQARARSEREARLVRRTADR